MNPKVSVIIPNYNHAVYLRQRIDSVLNQTYRDFEVIILDDFSTDSSLEIIESFRDHSKVKHIVFNEKNSGSPFEQWKKGLALAKGEFIWIAESDDYCETTFIETLLPEFSDKEVGIVFCSSHWVDTKGSIGEDLSLYFNSFKENGQKLFLDKLIYTCVIPNASSALIRRSFISKKSLNIGKFRYCGDWMFYADVLTRSNISFVDKKLNFFRWYHNNSSNEAIRLGKWTDEGVHVLRFLDKNEYLDLKILRDLYKEWMRRTNRLPGFRRLKAKYRLLHYTFLAVIYFSTNKLKRVF